MFEELSARLNDREYKNWLKAARCLLLLREALHPFVSRHMSSFHGELLRHNGVLREPCRAQCRARGNTLPSPCRTCYEWQTVIRSHHRQRDTATVNWGNCFPPRWRTDFWEVAKAYMPRGQADMKAAAQCDASALLNLINFCDCFHSVDLKCVREVIRFRNELMHSCELRVRDEWMRQYRNTLKDIVRNFGDIPQMAAVGRQIEEMLTIDLSICVLDQTDSADLGAVVSDSVSQWEVSGDLISQWEAELLRERLRELLRAASDDDEDEDDVTKTQAITQLKRLQVFLQVSRDLTERFSAELRAISTLEAKE